MRLFARKISKYAKIASGASKVLPAIALPNLNVGQAVVSQSQFVNFFPKVPANMSPESFKDYPGCDPSPKRWLTRGLGDPTNEVFQWRDLLQLQRSACCQVLVPTVPQSPFCGVNSLAIRIDERSIAGSVILISPCDANTVAGTKWGKSLLLLTSEQTHLKMNALVAGIVQRQGDLATGTQSYISLRQTNEVVLKHYCPTNIDMLIIHSGQEVEALFNLLDDDTYLASRRHSHRVYDLKLLVSLRMSYSLNLELALIRQDDCALPIVRYHQGDCAEEIHMTSEKAKILHDRIKELINHPDIKCILNTPADGYRPVVEQLLRQFEATSWIGMESWRHSVMAMR